MRIGKRILIAAFTIGFGVIASAQGPLMRVRGTPAIIAIHEASIAVNIIGDVAETTMDLTFQNESKQPVEGEFMLPLPEGATISSYALEVNGALRDAVGEWQCPRLVRHDEVERAALEQFQGVANGRGIHLDRGVATQRELGDARDGLGQ